MPPLKKQTKPAQNSARLACEESWGAYVYTIGRKEFYDLYSVEIAGKRYSVDYVLHTETVYDMGHEYPASSIRYFIRLKFAGVAVPVFLDELLSKGVKITALSYAREKPEAKKKTSKKPKKPKKKGKR